MLRMRSYLTRSQLNWGVRHSDQLAAQSPEVREHRPPTRECPTLSRRLAPPEPGVFAVQRRLRPMLGVPRFHGMSAPIFDFSHLTPEERIELAEQLWDSLEPTRLEVSEGDAIELRRRRAALEADGGLGEPWREALDSLEGKNA